MRFLSKKKFFPKCRVNSCSTISSLLACPTNFKFANSHNYQKTKSLPTRQETRVQSLGWEDALEKEMVTHSSILTWKILWMEEPGGLQSMGSQRVRHYWATNTFIFYNYTVMRGFPGGLNGKEFTCNVGDLGLIPGLGRSPGGGQGNPLQYSCLENPHWQRSLASCSPWGCKELTRLSD